MFLIMVVNVFVLFILFIGILIIFCLFMENWLVVFMLICDFSFVNDILFFII